MDRVVFQKDDTPWGLEKQQAYIKAMRLHHDDALEFYEFYHQWSGMGSGATLGQALVEYETIPVTRRNDVLTIGTYHQAMEKEKREDDKGKDK